MSMTLPRTAVILPVLGGVAPFRFWFMGNAREGLMGVVYYRSNEAAVACHGKRCVSSSDTLCLLP
ncbi:hypothetical protein Thini_0466 [Thiothrix nivea DSM 5205]|uniref:Uncharacterized protein n=1 Tax=Thiothrix nivea (strain ATCC 35100 / DSM 5205 / JP2) TaxID=870187 RepID=A0A656HAH9_THINJ|nr:hypothetical protein Thini_0466 [Thiothrix nivea DSM 5205]